MSGVESLSSHIWPDHCYTHSGIRSHMKDAEKYLKAHAPSQLPDSSISYGDHQYVSAGTAKHGDHQYASAPSTKNSVTVVSSTSKVQDPNSFNANEEKKAFVKRRKPTGGGSVDKSVVTKVDFPSKGPGDSLLKSAVSRPLNFSSPLTTVPCNAPRAVFLGPLGVTSCSAAMFDVASNYLSIIVAPTDSSFNVSDVVKKSEQKCTKDSNREVLSPIGNKEDVLNEQFRQDRGVDGGAEKSDLCCLEENQNREDFHVEDMSDHLYSMHIPVDQQQRGHFSVKTEQNPDTGSPAASSLQTATEEDERWENSEADAMFAQHTEVKSENGEENTSNVEHPPVCSLATVFQRHGGSLRRNAMDPVISREQCISNVSCDNKVTSVSYGVENKDKMLEPELISNIRRKRVCQIEDTEPQPSNKLLILTENKIETPDKDCFQVPLNPAPPETHFILLKNNERIELEKQSQCRHSEPKTSRLHERQLTCNRDVSHVDTIGSKETKNISEPPVIRDEVVDHSVTENQYSFCFSENSSVVKTEPNINVNEQYIDANSSIQSPQNSAQLNTIDMGIVTKPLAINASEASGNYDVGKSRVNLETSDQAGGSESTKGKSANFASIDNAPKHVKTRIVESRSDILNRIDSLINQNSSKLDGQQLKQGSNLDSDSERKTKIASAEEIRKESLKRIELLLQQNESISSTKDLEKTPQNNVKMTLGEKLRLVKESISEAQSIGKSLSTREFESRKYEAIRRIEQLINDNERNIQGSVELNPITDYGSGDTSGESAKHESWSIRERKRAHSFTAGEYPERRTDSNDQALIDVECMLVTKKAEKDSIHDHAYFTSNANSSAVNSKTSKLLKSVAVDLELGLKQTKKKNIKRLYKSVKKKTVVPTKPNISSRNLTRTAAVEEQLGCLLEESNPLLILAQISENESRNQGVKSSENTEGTQELPTSCDSQERKSGQDLGVVSGVIMPDSDSNIRAIIPELDNGNRAIIQDHTYEEDKVNTQQFSILRDHSYKKLVKSKKIKHDSKSNAGQSVDHTYTPKP